MLSTHLVSEETAQVFPRVTRVYFPPTMCEVFRSPGSCWSQYLSLTSLTLFVQVYGVSSWLRLAFISWLLVLSSFHVADADITWKSVPSCLFSISYRIFFPFFLCVLIMLHYVLIRRPVSGTLQIFPVCSFPFHSPKTLLEQKHFILVKSNFITYFLWIVLLVSCLKNSLPSSGSWRFSPESCYSFTFYI